jgi:hypothetical protein
VKRLIAVLAGLLLLAGCTGVPTSSAPETVEPLVTEPASNIPPPPVNLNGDPRTVVQSFLAANATNTANHNTARAYLTAKTSNRWSDDTATVIANDYSVSTYNARDDTVTVLGRVLGTLNASGIYTPQLSAVGGGGDKIPFVFDIAQVRGQFRIARLRAGLLLTDQQFGTTYQQHVVYFYDVAEKTLIPDLRWSALDDKALLAEWLIGQLAAGPRTSLQSAVSLDTLPAQTDVRQITVTLGNPTTIEIPGSSQLDAGVRDRLAAQLSETLFEPLAGRDMSITDGGRPVVIDSVGGNIFNASNFQGATGPQAPQPKVYYLSGGRIHDETDKSLSGPVEQSELLSSVAVGQVFTGGPLLIAGVVGTGAGSRLEVGTQRMGLHSTSVHGALTRPAFVPGRDEVWIGDGSQVFRVTVGEGRARVFPVPIPAVSGGGQVIALRLSPEGSRVAIVVSGAAGSAQLYVGSIVRGAGPVRIGAVEQISPNGVVVKDVAWLDSVRLFAIGYFAGSQDARTFESGIDGTEWTNEGLGNLFNPPQTVAAATGANVWVSAGGYVWKQSGSSWVSAGPTGQTPGSAPVYLE